MSILDDVGAFWNPSTPIDHVALYWQKMDPLANLEVKVIQSTNWG